MDERTRSTKAMIDSNFFSNIGFVSDSIEASHKIVGSIEEDIKDVRRIIQDRLQRRVDLEQLVELLQTENDCLKSQLMFLESQVSTSDEKLQERVQALHEEYEDQLLVGRSEMDRVIAENQALKEEKESILVKARELDTYCVTIEGQFAKLQAEFESSAAAVTPLQEENINLKTIVNSLLVEKERQLQHQSELEMMHRASNQQVEQLALEVTRLQQMMSEQQSNFQRQLEEQQLRHQQRWQQQQQQYNNDQQQQQSQPSRQQPPLHEQQTRPQPSMQLEQKGQSRRVLPAEQNGVDFSNPVHQPRQLSLNSARFDIDEMERSSGYFEDVAPQALDSAKLPLFGGFSFSDDDVQRAHIESSRYSKNANNNDSGRQHVSMITAVGQESAYDAPVSPVNPAERSIRVRFSSPSQSQKQMVETSAFDAGGVDDQEGSALTSDDLQIGSSATRLHEQLSQYPPMSSQSQNHSQHQMLDQQQYPLPSHQLYLQGEYTTSNSGAPYVGPSISTSPSRHSSHSNHIPVQHMNVVDMSSSSAAFSASYQRTFLEPDDFDDSEVQLQDLLGFRI